jgi:hypothetical protein
VASTNTELAELARIRAGSTKRITDLESDKSPEADAIRVLLPQFRDELLEGFDWHFARGRAALQVLADVTRTDWGYVYAVPSDMLTARGLVYAGCRQPRPEDLIPYRLEAGDADPNPPEGETGEPNETILLTDAESAELIYTRRVTNPARFSALFTAALTWRLALDLATNVTLKADLATTAERQFVYWLGQAQVHAAKQEERDPVQGPEFLDGFNDGNGWS